MLVTFGIFWGADGLGVQWPLGDWSLPILFRRGLRDELGGGCACWRTCSLMEHASPHAISSRSLHVICYVLAFANTSRAISGGLIEGRLGAVGAFDARQTHLPSGRRVWRERGPMQLLRAIWDNVYGLLVEDGSIALGTLGALVAVGLWVVLAGANAALRDPGGPLLFRPADGVAALQLTRCGADCRPTAPARLRAGLGTPKTSWGSPTPTMS